MNIAVYLGSSEGRDPLFKEEVKRLGEMIGKAGHTLIYGGSKAGLMGAVADAVLSCGGEVIGVEPGFFIESEIQHDGINKLIKTESISERRSVMIDMSDLFIVYPGGIGTLDEMSEVFTLLTLERLDKKLIIYNLESFYDPLFSFFDKMEKSGFITEKNKNKLLVAADLKEINALSGGIFDAAFNT